MDRSNEQARKITPSSFKIPQDCLSLYPSICLSTCLSVCLPLCLFLCPDEDYALSKCLSFNHVIFSRLRWFRTRASLVVMRLLNTRRNVTCTVSSLQSAYTSTYPVSYLPGGVLLWRCHGNMLLWRFHGNIAWSIYEKKFSRLSGFVFS